MSPNEQAVASFVLALAVWLLGWLLGASWQYARATVQVRAIVATTRETDAAAAHGLDQIARVLDANGEHPDTRRVVARRLRDLATTIRATRIPEVP